MERQENKPTAKVLYRNEALIQVILDTYKKTVGTFQCVIDDLRTQGIEIDDNVLADLHNEEGAATTARLKEAIEKEVRGQRFPAMKDTIRKQLEPLYTPIVKAVELVEKSLYVSTIYGNAYLSVDDFIVKSGKVSLVEGLAESVAAEHSVFEGDDPVIDEAYNRGLKLKADIEDFDKFLRKHGDLLKPIDLRGDGYQVLRLYTSPTYRIDIDPVAFTNIHLKDPKF